MKEKKCSHGGKPCKMKQNTPTWVSDLSLNLDDRQECYPFR